MTSPLSIVLTQEPGELTQAITEIAQAQRLLIVAEQLGLNTAPLRSSLEQFVTAVSLATTPAPRRQLALFGASA